MRIGAISAVSDLMRPARPGRSTFEVVSPGIGSRADDERMIRIAGRSLARRCGSAARMSRMALRSVPSMAFVQAASSSSSNPPGGGPPELTSSRSRPPSAATARSTALLGPSGRGQVGVDGDGAGEAADGRVEAVRWPRRERDPRALADERGRDGATKPARAATDQRPRPVETQVHRVRAPPDATSMVRDRRRLRPSRAARAESRR